MAKQNNLLVGFYFELSFKGEDTSFQEVSGISTELNIEEVGCGGENRFKYKLPTGSKQQNLVLKRARTAADSQLVNWCTRNMSKSFAYPLYTHDVTVRLLKYGGETCKSWTFYNAYPVKYSVSNLKSTDNALLIESIELAYTFFDISKKTIMNNLFIG